MVEEPERELDGGPAAELAMARAWLWDWLAGIFSYPFSLEDFRSRVTAKVPAVTEAAAALAGWGYTLEGLAEAARAAAAIGGEEELADLEMEFVRLFDTPSPGNRLHPTESVQRQGHVDLVLAGELDRLYRRWGLQPAPDAGEMADHASLECAFLSYLAVEEARLRAAGQSAAAVEQAQAGLLSDHLLHWMPGWWRAVAETARHPLLAAAARIGPGLLAGDARLFGLRQPV
ncbi:MAG: molecular chaperone TorD family protein [Firmicutes bacterium]|nr:molecular chaperone TorD family protein [Bacillota bacterium]